MIGGCDSPLMISLTNSGASFPPTTTHPVPASSISFSHTPQLRSDLQGRLSCHQGDGQIVRSVTKQNPNTPVHPARSCSTYVTLSRSPYHLRRLPYPTYSARISSGYVRFDFGLRSCSVLCYKQHKSASLSHIMTPTWGCLRGYINFV